MLSMPQRTINIIPLKKKTNNKFQTITHIKKTTQIKIL